MINVLSSFKHMQTLILNATHTKKQSIESFFFLFPYTIPFSLLLLLFNQIISKDSHHNKYKVREKERQIENTKLQQAIRLFCCLNI